MNKLFDLRFAIGLFFTIVGLILIVYGFFSANREYSAVNWGCGLLFAVFGIFMLWLARKRSS